MSPPELGTLQRKVDQADCAITLLLPRCRTSSVQDLEHMEQGCCYKERDGRHGQARESNLHDATEHPRVGEETASNYVQTGVHARRHVQRKPEYPSRKPEATQPPQTTAPERLPLHRHHRHHPQGRKAKIHCRKRTKVLLLRGIWTHKSTLPQPSTEMPGGDGRQRSPDGHVPKYHWKKLAMNILIDPACTFSQVHPDFVDKDFSRIRTITVQGATGTKTFPTTKVSIGLEGKTFLQEVSVNPMIQHDAIMGLDVPEMRALLGKGTTTWTKTNTNQHEGRKKTPSSPQSPRKVAKEKEPAITRQKPKQVAETPTRWDEQKEKELTPEQRAHILELLNKHRESLSKTSENTTQGTRRKETTEEPRIYCTREQGGVLRIGMLGGSSQPSTDEANGTMNLYCTNIV